MRAWYNGPRITGACGALHRDKEDWMRPAVWTALYAELDLHKALRLLSEHGWHAFEASTEHLVRIELDEHPDELIAQTRRCLADLGLDMPQAHALLQADVAHPDEGRRCQDIDRLSHHIRLAAQLGVQTVVMHPGGRQVATTRAERDRVRALNVEAFCRLGDLAGEHGVRIGLENLMRRGASTPYDMLDLLEAIDHPAIGITLDTSHANVVGLDIPTVIREFGPYLVATHISDNDGSGDQHLTPGNGNIDWTPVVEALGSAGYDGLFNLEIPGERHRALALRGLKSRHACRVAEWLLTL
jgi:sugar phosphate isomerase/epimerase